MGKSILGKDQSFKTDDFFDSVHAQLEKKEPTVKQLPLEKITIKENIREEYGKIEEMAQSIKQKGLLQPITVTPTADGFYEIVFGHRRYKGMCLLSEQNPGQFTKIQAIVKNKEDFNEKEIKEVQLIENIQRENLSPIEVKGALLYFRESGLSNKEIADKLGKSEGFIHNTFSAIKTLESNEQLENLMKTNVNISLTDIHEIKPLPYKDQIRLIQEKLDGKINSVKELRERVRELKDLSYQTGRVFREQKNHYENILTEKDNTLRIKSFKYDPQETSQEDKNKLLSLLKTLITKIEGGTPIADH